MTGQTFLIFLKSSFPGFPMVYDTAILSEHTFLNVLGVEQEVGGTSQNILILKHSPTGK